MTATISARDARSQRWRLRARGAREFGNRFIHRTDGVVGLGILTVFTLMAIAPQLLVGPLETVVTATGGKFEPPSAEHILGTDHLGRDMLNLTVHGARISMVIGLLATIVTILIGAVIGIASGFLGGKTDNALMRVTDFFLVLPTFVLAIIIAPIILDLIGIDAQIFGIKSTLLVIVIAIGLTSWASTARVIRSQTLSVKERMFVDANTVLVFAVAVFTETTLAFIGLGDPFAPSWGQILNTAQSSGAAGLGAWWVWAPPAVCVVLVILAFTLVGNALDDILNPKSGVRR
jgi:peptide/nickel transport system permease protein